MASLQESRPMITITYHAEVTEGTLCVWAESDELPGFTAAGEGFSTVASLVREHLEMEGNTDAVVERVSDGSALHVWLLDGNDAVVDEVVGAFPSQESTQPFKSDLLVCAV